LNKLLMKMEFKNKILLKKILIGLVVFAAAVEVFAAQHLMSVQAHIIPVTVTPCKIDFGNVFPEEQLTSSFDVSLAESCHYDPGTVQYSVVQKIKPKPGAKPPSDYHGTISDYCQAYQNDLARCYRNLCPFLTKVGDSPSDTELSASLGGSDKKDKWTIKFLVPDIFGSVGQENEGGVVSEKGDYGCDIAIEIKEQPKTYKISGRKFEDKDGDGKFDFGEKGLLGWTIYLDANNNGKLDGGETSVTTDNDGNYNFSGLAGGTYHVREVLKSGWKQTLPIGGKYNVVLGQIQNVTGKNFGNTKLCKISGHEFEDKNGNGRQDRGEGGMANWVIQLREPDGTTHQTRTDKDGNYSFDNLEPGSYRLNDVAPSGWKQTTKSPDIITLHSGDVGDNNNFGNQKKK